MVRVFLDDTLLAESDAPILLEGNYYFQPDNVKRAHLIDSDTYTECPCKGGASYYSAKVGDNVVKDVAWYYAQPKQKAADIRGHVAFYKNKVTIQD